jgi:hypothetical protein
MITGNGEFFSIDPNYATILLPNVADVIKIVEKDVSHRQVIHETQKGPCHDRESQMPTLLPVF